jgi:hypothetical protein
METKEPVAPDQQTKKSILVIVPSRGRPHTVYGMYGAWWDTHATADFLFCVDDDDGYKQYYVNYANSINDSHLRVEVGPRARLCGSLNRAALANVDKYNVLAFMGDDHRPRSLGWDRRFAECLSAGPGICYGNDLLQGERIPTAVAMTADIVKMLGYFAPPILTHLNLDVVWKEWGQEMRRITYLHDVIIEHVHPANGKAPGDTGYAECNSPEMNAADNAAYALYHSSGNQRRDVDKLIRLAEVHYT